jgi:hypothetical protein
MNAKTAQAQELDLPEPQPQNQVPAVIENSPATMLQMIERAARDPAVNVDKMEKLLQMAERLEARDAKQAYTRAFLQMKPKLPIITRYGVIEVREKSQTGKRDGDVVQSSPYAKWEDIDEAITPILTEYGFVLTFKSGMAADGKVLITGILTHESGHSEDTTMALPHDSSGSKNSVQAVGSSLSYGKRYTATFLLNIRTKGEDDDGNAADADDVISTEEANELQSLLERSHSPEGRFFKYMGVDHLIHIKKKDMGKAREALNIALDVYQRQSKPKK